MFEKFKREKLGVLKNLKRSMCTCIEKLVTGGDRVYKDKR